MKRVIYVIAFLILCGAAQAFAQGGAQSSAGARDLFNTYKSDNTSAAASTSVATTGRPGVRVRIELDRGGRARWVSPKTTFQAGDRVRFHFNMNFAGYVVIINQGSSGKRTLLFPYEGVSNRVGRTADYTVPQGEAWFEFDQTAGDEQLTFIMSKREIQEVTQLTTVGGAQSSTQVTNTQPQAHAATPAPAASQSSHATSGANNHGGANAQMPAAATPQTEEQEILAALNSRSLAGGRDLKMSEEGGESYVLATDNALAKPIGFRLTLKHR
jgi:hypothetical protein